MIIFIFCSCLDYVSISYHMGKILDPSMFKELSDNISNVFQIVFIIKPAWGDRYW